MFIPILIIEQHIKSVTHRDILFKDLDPNDLISHTRKTTYTFQQGESPIRFKVKKLLTYSPEQRNVRGVS